jgi:hypothetical protein
MRREVVPAVGVFEGALDDVSSRIARASMQLPQRPTCAPRRIAVASIGSRL